MNSFTIGKAIESNTWNKIDDGLYIGEFSSDTKKEKPEITVVRISPLHYSFRLLCAKELETENRRTSQHGFPGKCNQYGCRTG